MQTSKRSQKKKKHLEISILFKLCYGLCEFHNDNICWTLFGLDPAIVRRHTLHGLLERAPYNTRPFKNDDDLIIKWQSHPRLRPGRHPHCGADLWNWKKNTLDHTCRCSNFTFASMSHSNSERFQNKKAGMLAHLFQRRT